MVMLTGCVATRSDLSLPRTWQELGDEPVVVSTDEVTLPIVSADTKRARAAALFLASTIEETCGRRPDVLVVSKGQTCAVTKGMFVGDEVSKFQSFRGDGDGGFRVVAKEGSVRFLGREDYAVYDWCERMLGMRYYCDGGKCVEKRDEVVVPSVDYADAPVFARRTIWGGQTKWARYSKSGNAHRGGVNVHAPTRWIADAKLKATHPEIFENGETPMLCYGNPATLDYYKRRIDRHIAGLEPSGGIVDTNRHVVTVCQWDAPVSCSCVWCRTLRSHTLGKGGEASPIVWGHFLTKLDAWLAEAHPDYMISFLPYLNTCAVPRDFANALQASEAEVCTMPGLALLKDDACRAREEKLLRDWQAATGRKVINWHYGCWPQDWTSAPYVFGKTISRHYRDLRDVTDGSFICGGATDARLALSMYVWLRCLWNPDVDIEAIYDEFARRMFGAGAHPMRKLIALQEECWERGWDGEACSYHNLYEVSYRPRDIARMKALLQEAFETARAAADETGARRIRWYASGFRTFLEEEAAARVWRPRRIRVGETNELVAARSVRESVPWARTTLVTVRDGSAARGLTFVVRCEDPAAARMDFTKLDRDFVHGDDCVTFAFAGVGAFKVYKTGLVESARAGFRASVAHDATGWTVTARVDVPAGGLRGNVSRWRVGDVRFPRSERVAGSRYEHSRLSTRFTQPDDDPAAFVEFDIISGNR